MSLDKRNTLKEEKESIIKENEFLVKKKLYEKGLSHREANQKLKHHGPNTLTGKKKISPLKILFEQFSDFMVLILLASTAASIFLGEVTEAIAIITIVAVNAILGFIQEFRTEKSMEALKSLAAPAARVIRDGVTVSVPAEKIVPGDVVVLEAGDRIPADAHVVECNSLMADESLLTGESVPAEKKYNDQVFMGTIITGGRARAIVYATGMETEMGRIADMIQEIEEEQTPLQVKLDHLGKYIVFGCLFICSIVTAAGVLRGESIFEMFLSGVSLAVAAIPESLPAIVTITLAIGVQKMLKRNALIRKLPAVETLGCASVICSDKTGTLTENRMTVRKIYAGEITYSVSGNGYNLDGEFKYGNKKIDVSKDAALRHALEISTLCNNAELKAGNYQRSSFTEKISGLFSGSAGVTAMGDPTEIAMLVAGAKAGITADSLGKTYFKIDEAPFDSEKKCMSIICVNDKGETYVFTKGAPDVVIHKCTRVFTRTGVVPMPVIMKKRILETNENMASEALRVLGVGFRKLDSSKYNKKNIENELIFVGLIGMIDPPRGEALKAVQTCKFAGIKPVMITGDHKATAAAVAVELGILEEGGKVVTGIELERMSDVELGKVCEHTSVYARVQPKHKLRIVRSLKAKGHIVAMTGDGVNDAPAIKEADIGVSMGITGTDVTKEASSMILLDDNFATIVAAVEEGRGIYNNIRKFIRYMLSCNIGEVLTMFIGTFLSMPLPLLPIQILWVNLVTDGLPAIALAVDPPEKDVMLQSPRGANESIFSRGLAWMIIFRGILIGLCTLGVFTSIYYFTGDTDTARTAAFVTLCVIQLIHVFECKSERKNIFDIQFFNNIYLVVAVLCSLAMLLGVVYIPFCQGVFETVSLTLNEWIIILGFSLAGPVLSSFFIGGRKR